MCPVNGSAPRVRDQLRIHRARSGIGTALPYRSEVLGRWVRHNADFGLEVLHGIAVTSFGIPGRRRS